MTGTEAQRLEGAEMEKTVRVADGGETVSLHLLIVMHRAEFGVGNLLRVCHEGLQLLGAVSQSIVEAMLRGPYGIRRIRRRWGRMWFVPRPDKAWCDRHGGAATRRCRDWKNGAGGRWLGG